MAKHMHAEGYFYGLLLLLWMGSIFYLSGQPGGVSESLSQGISRMLTDKIASWCGLELDVRLWHFWLRKAAHAFLYVPPFPSRPFPRALFQGIIALTEE